MGFEVSQSSQSSLLDLRILKLTSGSWYIQLLSSDAPYRHEQLRKESKGKGRAKDEQQSRRDALRPLDTTSLAPPGTYSGLYDYSPVTNFGFAPFPIQQTVTLSAGSSREQTAINVSS